MGSSKTESRLLTPGPGPWMELQRKRLVSQWHVGPGLGGAVAQRLLEGKDLPSVHLHLGMAEVGVQEQGSSSRVSRQVSG